MRKNDKNNLRKSPEGARNMSALTSEEGLVFPGSSHGASEFDKSWSILVILKKFPATRHWRFSLH